MIQKLNIVQLKKIYGGCDCKCYENPGTHEEASEETCTRYCEKQHWTYAFCKGRAQAPQYARQQFLNAGGRQVVLFTPK